VFTQALGFLYAAGLGVNSSQAKVSSNDIHQAIHAYFKCECLLKNPVFNLIAGIGVLHFWSFGWKPSCSYDSGKKNDFLSYILNKE